MREHFRSIIDYTTHRIPKGDEQIHGATKRDLPDDHNIDREVKALSRAIACLAVAVEGKRSFEWKPGELQWFRYVAAGYV